MECAVCKTFVIVMYCYSYCLCYFPVPEKQTMEQARLIQQLEEEQEADGEEDDDEDDEDGEQEEVWRRVSPGGRPEARGPGYPEEALRKRVVGNREEDEDS